MAVMGIMLVLGLIVTFVGAALLGMERKERKKALAAASEEQAAKALEENNELIKEGEEPALKSGYVPNIGRLKLGMLWVFQGSLAAIVAIGLFFVNAYVVKIPWYITLPVAVVYFGVCFLVDALLMAPKGDVSGEQTPAEDEQNQEPQETETKEEE